MLLISSQKRLQSLEQAGGILGQGARQRLLGRQHDRGYRAGSSGEPVTVSDSWHPLMIEARESGQIVFGDPVADANTLAVPVKIREQVVGVVRLRKPEEGSRWRPEEVALVQRLSDRLSAALESARLFEETRRTAEREHLTGEITARMRSTNDPQVVLQIAARELRKALRADKARILVQTAVSHPPKVDEADADIQAGDHP
jgi:GAF domain-containing protein